MLYSQNKKARFDYDILDTVEAGIVLSGAEVKAIREGSMQLKGAYVTFHNNEAHLLNAYIGPYKYAIKKDEYQPERTRVLLLKRKEIAYLQGKRQENGLTILPLSVYNKGRHIKIELGIARGKKKYDKRASVKERDVKKEIARKMKDGR